MSPRSIAISSLLLACAACRAKTDATPAPSAAAAAVAPAHAHDSLDERTPVPLLPMMAHHQKQNMRDHLVAVQEITAAVARNDFAAVGAAVKRIGYSEQMGRMCEHMGSAAPGFTELALEFHHRADAIGAAAKSQDPTAVSTALAETLTVCTNCHARFKQQIVDEPTWAALPRR
jgi:hypothetical protein